MAVVGRVASLSDLNKAGPKIAPERAKLWSLLGGGAI